ncbi:hypothetical protein [Campylobacter concisus]|uniref:hypothetical protein n=1 Tax=Campylobacter concisus TaxID=199 RepID=UPI00131C4BF5|nr:hypothetical protein [Campylobacter concisus]
MRNLLEFCACDIPMAIRPVCNRCLAKDAANVRTLTATKQVGKFTFSSKFTQQKNYKNLRKIAKLGSP